MNFVDRSQHENGLCPWGLIDQSLKVTTCVAQFLRFRLRRDSSSDHTRVLVALWVALTQRDMYWFQHINSVSSELELQLTVTSFCDLEK
jgi:hypothetical protein